MKQKKFVIFEGLSLKQIKRFLVEDESPTLSSFFVLECCSQFSENFLYRVLLRHLFITK